jgi:hypothetical protein
MKPGENAFELVVTDNVGNKSIYRKSIKR